MHFVRTVPWVKLQESLIVLPALGPGNVGELTVDALIVSLGFQRVGFIDDPNVLPCVGNDPYYDEPAGTLTINLELYGKNGCPLYILQQRAPTMVGRQQHFAGNVAKWIKQAGFRSTLVLCGLSSQYRRAKQMEGPQLRCLTQDPQTEKQLQALQALPLEEELLTEEQQAHSLLPPWVLLSKCEAEGVGSTTLGVFTSEGDNIPDAMTLLQCVVPYLKQQPGLAELAVDAGARPVSWQKVYGRSFEKSLYTL